MKHLLFAFVLFFSLSACKSKQAVSTSNQTTSQEKVSPRSGDRTSTGQRPGRGERKAPPSIDEVFKMDTNGDGKLAKSEIKGRLLEKFDAIDTDNDGFISKTEFQNMPRPQRGQRPPKQ